MPLRRATSRMPVTAAVAACAALAALTLLVAHRPTYDPWAWLLWGREIAHGTLDTVGGPSWKPLPVFFTVPFTAAAGAAAPGLWVEVARTGFLLGVVAAYVLAASVAGRVAGALAAAGVLLIDRFVSLSGRGDSEGILVALALGAFVLHGRGRRGAALAAALGACLVRPEVWPFAAGYALWLALRHVPRERRARALVGLAACGLLVLAAWFVPEQVGSGSLLRGASRAREPVPDSPAQAAIPFLAVFGNSAGSVAIPLYAGGVAAVALAWRRAREPLVLLLAAAATAYMVIVAVLAQAGFTGNQRYVLLPASAVCVLGGIGLVQGARALAPHGRWLVALLALAAVALAVSPARRLDRQVGALRDNDRLYARLPAAAAAVPRGCGPVFTDPFQTQPVMWELHETGTAVGIFAHPPGTIVAPRGTPIAGDARFPLRASNGQWVVRSTCPLNGT